MTLNFGPIMRTEKIYSDFFAQIGLPIQHFISFQWCGSSPSSHSEGHGRTHKRAIPGLRSLVASSALDLPVGSTMTRDKGAASFRFHFCKIGK